MSKSNCNQEVGVVKKVRGNLCYVNISKSDICNGCKACAFGKDGTMTVKAENKINCNEGDKVIVSLHAQNKTKLAFSVLFCFPLALMVVFAIIAEILFGNQFVVLGGITLGIALGFFIAYLTNKLVENFDRKKGIFPRVIKKI